MATWGQMRAFSLLATALFCHFTLFSTMIDRRVGGYIFFVFVSVFLYSHYLMALKSTLSRLRDLGRYNRGRILLFFIFFLPALSVWYETELSFIWFGVHFAMSEVYSRFLIDGDRSFYADTTLERRMFRALQGLFITCAYFMGTAHTFKYVMSMNAIAPYLTQQLFIILTIISGATYFAYLYWFRQKLFPKTSATDVFWAYGLPEIVIACLAGFAGAHAIHWSIFVFYHIIYWLVAPAVSQRQHQPLSEVALRYALPTLALFLLAIPFAPSYLGGRAIASYASYGYLSETIPFTGFDFGVFHETFVSYVQTTMNWGVLHIAISFFASTLNPAIFRRIGNPGMIDPLQR